jgi:hypothetical protein
MVAKKQSESKTRKKINALYEESELANLESNKNRARSFTVGTAFGGIIEVSMRGDFSSLWCLLQPVEAVEFIEQLAAAAGLQVALRPKQDFASWRGWDVNTDNRYWVGSARWQIDEVDSGRKALESGEEGTENALSEEQEKKVSKKRKKNKVEVVIDDEE